MKHCSRCFKFRFCPWISYIVGTFNPKFCSFCSFGRKLSDNNNLLTAWREAVRQQPLPFCQCFLFTSPPQHYWLSYCWCTAVMPVIFLYTVGHKKRGTLLLSISSPIIDQFSKFFHWHTLQAVCKLSIPGMWVGGWHDDVSIVVRRRLQLRYLLRLLHAIHRVLKKNRQNGFGHDFVKFLPTLIIFGTKVAKTILLCTVYSFTTSPNLCQRITAWNTDAPNCYIMRRLFVSDGSPLHHHFDRGCNMV